VKSVGGTCYLGMCFHRSNAYEVTIQDAKGHLEQG
jgi:hypothetical protein